MFGKKKQFRVVDRDVFLHYGEGQEARYSRTVKDIVNAEGYVVRSSVQPTLVQGICDELNEYWNKLQSMSKVA